MASSGYVFPHVEAVKELAIELEVQKELEQILESEVAYKDEPVWELMVTSHAKKWVEENFDILKSCMDDLKNRTAWDSSVGPFSAIQKKYVGYVMWSSFIDKLQKYNLSLEKYSLSLDNSLGVPADCLKIMTIGIGAAQTAYMKQSKQDQQQAKEKTPMVSTNASAMFASANANPASAPTSNSASMGTSMAPPRS